MLEIRPSCENCDKALPPESTDAMVCSFECTFCRDCVQHVLGNVCPNCGGGFCARPIRPADKLTNNPASVKKIFKPVDAVRHAAFSASIKDTPPERR